MILTGLLRATVFSAMNRVRGGGFGDFPNSTTAGRLLATFVMALSMIVPKFPADTELSRQHFLAMWLLLYGWTILKWDIYWGAAIGNDPKHSKLWGATMMTLRNLLLLPFYAYCAWLSGDWFNLAYSASILLMGAVYVFWGDVTPNDGGGIQNSELTNGFIMGVTSHLILNGGL